MTVTMRFGDAVARSPRQLSGNEARMLSRSADAIRRMHRGISGPALSLALDGSLSAILCNGAFWSELAQKAVARVTAGKEGSKARDAAILRYEGMVIGMVEVMDIRYDRHEGHEIAQAIDDATRPQEFELLSGFVSSANAFDIISRAYAGTAVNGATRRS